MKNILYKSSKWSLLVIFAVICLSACVPDAEDESLGMVPTASFSIEPVAGEVNQYVLKNTTEGGFAFYWDMGSGNFSEGSESEVVYLPWIGEFTIALRVLTSGGAGELTQTITVTEADPNACSGNLARLTGCSSKTWILAQPEGGALFVGPPGFGSAWWSNNADDINAADRVCLFDNEYTFHAQGDFVFDNQGTMRVDDEGGAAWPTDMGLDIGCYDMAQIPSQYQAWGSGNHLFSISDTELSVIGEGAHLGLYKVGDSGGALAAPESSVTYTIVSMTDDQLVIEKAFDWGGWRFTLKPKP